MKKEQNWLVPIVLIVVALAAFALMNRSPRAASTPLSGRPAATSAPAVPAPEGQAMGGQAEEGPAAIPFTAKTVDGKSVSLSDYRGKVVLLDFWASWCPPCRAEAPNVVRAYARYHARGFDVLGVSLDQDRNAMHAFEKQAGMTWPQILDQENGNALSTKYQVDSIPTMLLVDGTTGRVVAVNPMDEELAPAIEAALARQHG